MTCAPVLDGIEALKVMKRGGIVAPYMPWSHKPSALRYRIHDEGVGRPMLMCNLGTGGRMDFVPMQTDLEYFVFTTSVFVEVSE